MEEQEQLLALKKLRAKLRILADENGVEVEFPPFPWEEASGKELLSRIFWDTICGIEPADASWRAERETLSRESPGEEYSLQGFIGRTPVWAPRSPYQKILEKFQESYPDIW